METDERIQAFLIRPLQESGYADVDLDATDLNGRKGKAQQFTSHAAVVAMGTPDVNSEGRRMFSAESLAAIPDLESLPALQTASA